MDQIYGYVRVSTRILSNPYVKLIMQDFSSYYTPAHNAQASSFDLHEFENVWTTLFTASRF
jgi:hypothetical protein